MTSEEQFDRIDTALIAIAEGLQATERLINATAQTREHTQHMVASLAESITRYVGASDARKQ